MTEADPTRLMLGYLCIATEIGPSLPRKVQILDRFDFQNKDIAKICGATEQSIKNARVLLKKKKKKKSDA